MPAADMRDTSWYQLGAGMKKRQPTTKQMK